MTCRCVEYLLREHRAIEQAFADLESLLDSPQTNRPWNDQDARAFSRVARCFNECEVPHLRKEEAVLFPALEDFLPRDTGPLAVLRGEHRDLDAHFRVLRDTGEMLGQGKCEPQLSEDFQRAGRALLRILQDHFYKEERVLFPMLARFFSEARDAELVARMEAMSPAKTSLNPAD